MVELIKYWKLIVAIICFIGSVATGFYISNKMWSSKYASLEAQYNGCQTSFNTCLNANEENVTTIEKLKRELKQQQLTCEQRVNYYKKLIKQMQKIDSLTGGQSEKPVSYDCPDDVCAELYRMFR